MATSSYWQCASKVELNKDQYIIHLLSPCEDTQPAQSNRTKSNNKNTNKPNTTPKTARPVISWSVHSNLKRIRRDDSIVSPLGLVWQMKNKSETNNNTKMPYSNLWARKQQRHNAETEAPPSQEPRDHRVQAARFWTLSKSQQWHCHVAKGKLKLNIVKRGVKTDLRWNNGTIPALSSHSDSSQVCFFYLQHWRVFRRRARSFFGTGRRQWLAVSIGQL